MSLNEVSVRDKYRPRPLDQIEPQVYVSKDNTNKSMQESLYDCDMTSINTLGLSSGRGTRRNESVSSKSRISSRNMLEFEEFNIDNTIELSKPVDLFGTVVNNMDSKEKGINYDSHNKSDLMDHISNQSFNKVEMIVENIDKAKTILKNNEPLTFFQYKKKTIQLSDDLETENETPFARVESQSGTTSPVQQISNGFLISNKSNQNKSFNMENILEGTKTKDTLNQSQRTPFDGVDLNKTSFINEFYNLKEEVSSIQKDLKSSENYNKKLEEYIQSQTDQINSILKTCNNLRGENDLLKKNLTDIIEKKNGEVEEISQLKPRDRHFFRDIDHVVAIKANHFYKEEVEYMRNKYRTELKNQTQIIQNLNKELDSKNREIEELKAIKFEEKSIQSVPLPETVLVAKSSMTTNPSTFDPLQSKTICSNSDSLAMDFQTPHRFQMKENKFFNSSCEEPNEIKSLSATNQLNDQISPTDLKYIQHMAEISEKLDVMKRKEKLSAKKVLNKSQERGNMPSNYQSEYGVSPNQHYLISSQISKYRTNPNLGEKSSKPQNREFSPFASDNTKLSRQGNLEEVSLEEGRVSLPEGLFENMGGKDLSRRELEEFSPFNMSPAGSLGDHVSSYKESIATKKFDSTCEMSKPIEMDRINESLSEQHYFTDSIHNRLTWELQKQFNSNSRAKSKEAKNMIPKEDFINKAYPSIQKTSMLPQSQKRKVSNSTPNSRTDITEKSINNDSISMQKSKEESINIPSKPVDLGKWKEIYSNQSSKKDKMNVLKSSNLNILKPSPGLPSDLKQNKTPMNYDKSQELYSKLYSKGSEKKSRSVATSQDKIRKHKEKSEHISKAESSSIFTQANDTVMSIHSSIEKMLERSQGFRPHSSLEREQKFMQTQPYIRNEISRVRDEFSPQPIDSEGGYRQSKMSTAPLASYLKLAKSGKTSENHSLHASQRANITDVENKENRSDHNPRITTLSTKGSKNSLFVTESQLDNRSAYISSIDKLATVSLKSGLEASKGSSHKKSPNPGSSQVRHQTPTTKVYLDVFPSNNSKAQSKSVKMKEKHHRPEAEEIQISGSYNIDLRASNSRYRSSSNKPSNTPKSGMRSVQGYTNYPVYNNFLNDNGSLMNKSGKMNHHLSLDQKSYDSSYPIEKESIKKSRDEVARYEGENFSHTRDTYTGQFLAKNKRESYKPYNLYSYDSKKY